MHFVSERGPRVPSEMHSPKVRDEVVVRASKLYNSPKNMVKTPKFKDNNREYYRSNILNNKVLSGSTRASREGGFFSEHIR